MRYCCPHLGAILQKMLNISIRKMCFKNSWGLLTPYGNIDEVNIGPGNGLLPDSIKPLPEQMLTYLQQGPATFFWQQFYIKYINHQSQKIARKWPKFSFQFPRGQWVNYINHKYNLGHEIQVTTSITVINISWRLSWSADKTQPQPTLTIC